MLMPEATIDQDDGPVPGQDDVGHAGEVAPVEHESVTHPVESRSDADLGTRVGLADAAHDPLPCREVAHRQQPTAILPTATPLVGDSIAVPRT